MKTFYLSASAILACAALACGTADAAPRASQEMGGAMLPDADLDVWLRRLVGRYRFEGVVDAVMYDGCALKEAADGGAPYPPEYCHPIKGMGDCIAIGGGPGVQCVLNVRWEDMYRVVYDGAEPGVFAIPGGVSNLDPAMLLFGLDPGKAALSYLLVDHKGFPEGGPAVVTGNRATFETFCVNAPALFLEMKLKKTAICYRTIRIDAKPDAKVLHLSMDIDLEVEGIRDTYTRVEMTLRRVQDVEDK